MRVSLLDGNDAVAHLEFLLGARQLVRIDSPKGFNILEYLVVLVGKLNTMSDDVVPPTPYTAITHHTHASSRDDAPLVETEGRRPSVASSILCNCRVERVARSCAFRFPCYLGVADELEDGVGTAGIGDQESVGCERVVSEGLRPGV